MSLRLFVSTPNRKAQMNSDTPFNPLPLPDGLLLAQETSHTPPPPPSAEPSVAQKTAPRSKHNARGRTRTRFVGTGNASQQSRWQRIKGKFAARIAQLDPETLRSVLLACGVAVGIVAAVLLLVKMVPTALVLLALLGVALIIAIWDRIRRFPYGF